MAGESAGLVTERAVLVIAGPTGVGKSRLGIDVAQAWGAEIVSADSRQLYRGLDIGTDTPSVAERQGVPHHLIDVLDPTEPVNAGWFAQHARQAAEAAWARGREVVVVGGSTLYVHALVAGLAPLPSLPPGLELELADVAATAAGRADLFKELQRLDPDAAASLDASKSQRLVRLLGVVRHTGRRVSDVWKDAQPAPLRTRLVVLERPRPELYRRIDRRVLDMLGRGLVAETQRVLDTWPASRPILESTIGYRELLPVLAGDRSLEDATALIQRNSRRYAKRQLTWYRRYPDALWLQADAATPGAVLQALDHA